MHTLRGGFPEGDVQPVRPHSGLPRLGFGVRIEDEVLVTKTGHRLLTGVLPRDPDAIEKLELPGEEGRARGELGG